MQTYITTEHCVSGDLHVALAARRRVMGLDGPRKERVIAYNSRRHRVGRVVHRIANLIHSLARIIETKEITIGL